MTLPDQSNSEPPRDLAVVEFTLNPRAERDIVIDGDLNIGETVTVRAHEGVIVGTLLEAIDLEEGRWWLRLEMPWAHARAVAALFEEHGNKVDAEWPDDAS